MKTDKVNTTLHFSFLFCQFVCPGASWSRQFFNKLLSRRKGFKIWEQSLFIVFFVIERGREACKNVTQALDFHFS
jgi:hypothetical protein